MSSENAGRSIFLGCLRHFSCFLSFSFRHVFPTGFADGRLNDEFFFQSFRAPVCCSSIRSKPLFSLSLSLEREREKERERLPRETIDDAFFSEVPSRLRL